MPLESADELPRTRIPDSAHTIRTARDEPISMLVEGTGSEWIGVGIDRPEEVETLLAVGAVLSY